MGTTLITGGAGFTGANFAHSLLERGERVIVFDNLSRTGSGLNLEWLQGLDTPGQLEVIVGDVRRPPPELGRIIEESDALLHFAGQVAVTASVTDPRHDFETNALGTLNMLELVRHSRGKRPVVCYASTNKVYGGMEDLATQADASRYRFLDLPLGIPEERNLDFHSPYGCSKGAADQYVRDYARIFGLDTIVFRQSCIYGQRQFGIEDQGWVAWFVIAAQLGRPIKIFGDGKQVRDVLFVEDLVSCYVEAIAARETCSGRVYNIGGGPENAISLLDLLGYLGEKLGRPVPVTFGDWRPGDQPIYVSDIRRAAIDFDWRPRTDWREGVGSLWAWVHDHRDMLASLV